eukprot:TRINITY_DN1121_c0_g1_i1.p1 TRINITY_DN1121_c0_g1~~TRINITY_DN1121_c0_g1_i1.p1  ORF type:complete len:174 (-),score=22.28 TRINITY_DN1121_c0_g1_i1:87-608(-)
MGNSQGIINMKEAKNRMDPAIMIECEQKWAKHVGDRKTQATFKQFCLVMEENASMDEMKALFKLYDANHNGKISFGEYVCCLSLTLEGSADEKLAMIFNAFDANGDGQISKEELSAAVKNFSQEKNPKFVDMVMKNCDINGDGFISCEEFSTFVKNDPELYAQICTNLNIQIS